MPGEITGAPFFVVVDWDRFSEPYSSGFAVVMDGDRDVPAFCCSGASANFGFGVDFGASDTSFGAVTTAADSVFADCELAVLEVGGTSSALALNAHDAVEVLLAVKALRVVEVLLAVKALRVVQVLLVIDAL